MFYTLNATRSAALPSFYIGAYEAKSNFLGVLPVAEAEGPGD